MIGKQHTTHTRDAALAKFRASQNLRADTGTAALYAALEAQARKVTAPAGYSICNDGTADIWAARGLRKGADFLSRGWWKVSSTSTTKSTFWNASRTLVAVARRAASSGP